MTKFSSTTTSASGLGSTALAGMFGAALKAFTRSFAARTAAELPQRLKDDAGLCDEHPDFGMSSRMPRGIEMEMLRRSF